MRVAINYATWKTRARALAVRFLHLAPSEIYSPDTPTISRKTRCKWQLLKARWIFEGFSSEREPIYQSLFTSYNREIVFSFFFSFFFIRSETSDKGVASASRHGYPLGGKRKRPTTWFVYLRNTQKKKKKKTDHPSVCTWRLSNSPSWHHRWAMLSTLRNSTTWFSSLNTRIADHRSIKFPIGDIEVQKSREIL